MSKQADNKRNTPSSTSQSTGTNAAKTKTPDQPVERNEEHTYDPVGMAGKKAGKVEQIEQQVDQGKTTGGKGGATKGKV